MAKNRNKRKLFLTKGAMFLLIFSLVDASFICYYIIKSHKNEMWIFIVLINMWFINNIRLKVSSYLFGGGKQDKKVINIAGNFLNSIRSKKDENKK